jgi:Fe-S cluster assembly iron-binding protein IscA
MSIGSNVNFLNATLENKNGNLYTYMYHDPIVQPFLLPYIPNHPRLGHRQWFRFALIRAGQYCLCLEDFHEERVQIELTFLANGYSLDFVEYHLAQFFKRFNPSSTQQPMDLNRFTYGSLRAQLFRHFRQQKIDQEERQQLKNKHQLIELYYLYDWGSRSEFNKHFYKLWTDILNKDQTFTKHGLKIILNSKHCFLSNTLLVQYKTN